MSYKRFSRTLAGLSIFVMAVANVFSFAPVVRAVAVVPTVSTYSDLECATPASIFNVGDTVYAGGSNYNPNGDSGTLLWETNTDANTGGPVDESGNFCIPTHVIAEGESGPYTITVNQNFGEEQVHSASADYEVPADSGDGDDEIIPECSGSSYFDDFMLGSVNGQGGWSATGPYDQDIVENTFGYASFGCKSLRVSNSTTSGSFGDQIISSSTSNEAGETTAANGGMSGGTRQSRFEAQFDLASVMPELQEGMNIDVSPDRGDGARMGLLRFTDTSDGISMTYFNYTDAAPFGSLETPSAGCNDEDNFLSTEIPGTLSRTAPHTIKITMDFVEGAANDVVKVYVDDNLVHTDTSWEDYFRWCTESGGGVVNDPAADVSRTVDSLMIRARGAAVPSNDGNGFLFDNFNLSATETPTSGGGSSSGSRSNRSDQGQVLGATTGTCMDTETASQQVSLYRFWNLAQTDHMYSTSNVAPAGFVSEGVVGSVYPSQVAGTVALHGLYNATTKDHFYTTSAAEAAASGYASLGIVGYVYETNVEGSHQMYRMWSGSKTDHFYTYDASEVNDAATKLGYQSETFSVYICGQGTPN